MSPLFDGHICNVIFRWRGGRPFSYESYFGNSFTHNKNGEGNAFIYSQKGVHFIIFDRLQMGCHTDTRKNNCLPEPIAYACIFIYAHRSLKFYKRNLQYDDLGLHLEFLVLSNFKWTLSKNLELYCSNSLKIAFCRQSFY